MPVHRLLAALLGGAPLITSACIQYPDEKDSTDPDAVADTDADAAPTWTSACPSLDASDVDFSTHGACTGVPTGELTREQADATLYRAFHEATHLDALAASGDDAGTWELAADDSGELLASENNGYARSVVASIDVEGAPAVCFDVQFTCFTGGHGGWGYAALEGRSLIAVTADEVHIVGTLGLVESGALTGAPASAVDVQIDAETGDRTGTMGEITY